MPFNASKWQVFRNAFQDLLPRYPPGRLISAVKYRSEEKMPFIPHNKGD
jgi:hypothetical protein